MIYQEYVPRYNVMGQAPLFLLRLSSRQLARIVEGRLQLVKCRLTHLCTTICPRYRLFSVRPRGMNNLSLQRLDLPIMPPSQPDHEDGSDDGSYT